MCAGLLCITAAASFGQKVSVNYNRNIDFSMYRTYALGRDNANQIKNSILAQNAQNDVNMALQSRGLQFLQDSTQHPDLYLTLSGGLKQETSWTTMSSHGYYGGGFSTITPEQNVVGTLVVELFDPKTVSIVWRGIAQDTLNNSGEKNNKKVAKAVTKMFKQYPSPAKK
jgi:hypothetical protein